MPCMWMGSIHGGFGWQHFLKPLSSRRTEHCNSAKLAAVGQSSG